MSRTDDYFCRDQLAWATLSVPARTPRAFLQGQLQRRGRRAHARRVAMLASMQPRRAACDPCCGCSIAATGSRCSCPHRRRAHRGAPAQMTCCGRPAKIEASPRCRRAHGHRSCDREAEWRAAGHRGRTAAGLRRDFTRHSSRRCSTSICSAAIDFDKGCYTGQEIIARAHYRGTVKRRMLRFRVRGASRTPGDRRRCRRPAREVVEVLSGRSDSRDRLRDTAVAASRARAVLEPSTDGRAPADSSARRLAARRGLIAQSSGRMCGNSSTSRIDGEFVKNMTNRSMPTPRPAVGGMPYSSART